MKGHAYIYYGIFASVTLFLSNAAAEPTPADKALALQLFEEAEKLVAAGNAAAACPKYSESQRRDPQLGTLLQLADCHEKVGKTASAWAGYKEAAEIAARRNAAGPSEPREQIARARAAALEPNLSTLTIVVTQTDSASLEIRQDGELVGHGAWGAPWPVDPGKYTISAQAKGKKPFVKVIEITSGGAKIEVTIPRLEEGEATASAAPPAMTKGAGAMPAAPQSVPLAPPPVSPERSTRGNQQRLIGYIVGGAGVVGLGVGAVFGLSVASKESERDAICPSGRCTRDEAQRIADINEEARSSAVATNVAVLLGGAAVLGGVALVLTASSGQSGTSAAAPMLRIGPFFGLNSAGASVQGRW
jgi:hypothetical protein